MPATAGGRPGTLAGWRSRTDGTGLLGMRSLLSPGADARCRSAATVGERPTGGTAGRQRPAARNGPTAASQASGRSRWQAWPAPGITASRALAPMASTSRWARAR